MIKDIKIEIDYTTWIKSVPMTLKSLPHKERFDLRSVLLHIGTVTSHPTDYGININSFWAYLRYINCFEISRDFKLNEKWNDIDSHQKTILSDDFGMGFASYYLTKYMNLICIVDTGFCIKHLPSLTINKKSKQGPSKTPDFILMDSSYNLHILECKGTQTSRGVLNRQITSGIVQKNNINDPSSIISEKLVTGIFIPQFNALDSAAFKIIDPEFELDFSNIEKNDLIMRLLQGQLAKEIHLAGQQSLANQIAEIDDLEKTTINNLFNWGNMNSLQQDKEIQINGIVINFYFDFDFLNKFIQKRGFLQIFVSDYVK